MRCGGGGCDVALLRTMRCRGGGFAGAFGRTTGASVSASGAFRFCEALLPLRGGLRGGVFDGTFKCAANLAVNGASCGCGVGALIYSYLF